MEGIRCHINYYRKGYSILWLKTGTAGQILLFSMEILYGVCDE